MLKCPLPLLLLAALTARAAPAPASAPVECGAELQSVELGLGASPVVVCVTPGVVTYLRFDTPLLMDRTVLEREGVSITPSPTGLTLEASRGLAAGERRKLTVSFADGKEPGDATFTLVAQSVGKPRQVNVFRHARTAASFRQEAQEQRQRAEQCEEQLSRCGEQATPPPLLERLLKLGGTTGLTLQWREVDGPDRQQGGIEVESISTTRMQVEAGQQEAAVRLRLRNKQQGDWRVEGASLTAGEGLPTLDARVLPDASLPGGYTTTLDVVVGPTPKELMGTYTLKLWGGGRELRLENITFP